MLCFPRLTEILNYVRKHTQGSQTTDYSLPNTTATLLWLCLRTLTARVGKAVSHPLHCGREHGL